MRLFFLAFIFIVIGFLLGRFFPLANGKSQGKKALCMTPCSVNNLVQQSSNLVLLEGMITCESSPGVEDISFPSSVGDFFMDKLITGEEALQYANRICGDDAPIQQVFISRYSSGAEQVILWIFEFSSTTEAREHMEKVQLRINDSQICTPSSSFYLENVEINFVQGLKLDNYYYNKQNLIYWVSLLTEDPIPLFLEFYQHF